MIRNLKALGLALVAVLAMSSLVASAASANPFWFKSDGAVGSTTTLTGSQIGQDVFEVDGGKITCSTATYSGSQVGNTATTITINPTYAGCIAFGTFPATVTMNSCRYVFHTDTKTAGTQYDVITTIECNGTDEITVTAKTAAGQVKCVIHVPAQNLGTGLMVTNATKGNGVKDVTADVAFTNIKYSQTEGEGLGKCPNALNTTNGKYTGSATLEGRNSLGGETDIWVE
jgi:hypothetical protein